MEQDKTELKDGTIEHFILYAAYLKSICKVHFGTLKGMIDSGILDVTEEALIESALLGASKLDDDLEELIKKCSSRSDKVDHLVVALNNLKKQGLME